MKLIFLDFDGVLNSREWFLQFSGSLFDEEQREGLPPPDLDESMDPEAVARLNRITDKTGAEIVVSSDWRLPFLDDVEGMGALMKKNGITGHCLGMLDWDNQNRGKQIQDWLNHTVHPIEKWIIIDDDSDPDMVLDKMINTDFQTGLLDAHVEQAIRMLGG